MRGGRWVGVGHATPPLITLYPSPFSRPGYPPPSYPLPFHLPPMKVRLGAVISSGMGEGGVPSGSIRDALEETRGDFDRFRV